VRREAYSHIHYLRRGRRSLDSGLVHDASLVRVATS
jgi:hypothetical protein